jgi:hypothetical protein
MMHLMRRLCNDFAIDGFQWIFCEAGHGKGAPDGVGAAVKRRADQYVAHGGTISKTADILAIMDDTKIFFRAEVRITDVKISIHKQVYNDCVYRFPLQRSTLWRKF